MEDGVKPMNKEKILEVKDLRTYFKTDDGLVRAVDGVTFDVYKGESFGIVGESGSGKSVTSLSIMRLVMGGKTTGEIIYKGQDLLKLSERKMQGIRGDDITMIFQDPMTSLDPVYTIGFQLREAIMRHKKLSRTEADQMAEDILTQVGFSQAKKRMKDYPHQLSGGMRQRVIIAMALVLEPDLLIADEPTTALDVTIQAQILDLIRSLKAKKQEMAMIMITHDLGVIAEICDRVMVMYCGQIVEIAPVKELFKNPQHEYTRNLLKSIPRLDEDVERLKAIPGYVPAATDFGDGCRFAERCSRYCEACKVQPKLMELTPGHITACKLHQDEFFGGRSDGK